MKTYSTATLAGKPVVRVPEGKKLGSVRWFLMHPTKRLVLGFAIKRSDLALLFHRKDLFVKTDDFAIQGGELVVREKPLAAGRQVEKACGVSWDDCVIWQGMQLLCESGESLGVVCDVRFCEQTGEIIDIAASAGIASEALLGKRIIPAEMIFGFKRANAATMHEDDQPDNCLKGEFGYILVKDNALQLPLLGGAASAAGKVSATVSYKVQEGSKRAAAAVQEKVGDIKPVAREVAQKTEDAASKGAFALGKQIGKASTMFSSFKEEYQKARNEEELNTSTLSEEGSHT